MTLWEEIANNMPTFLYLRGLPGSGKITVARILEKELGWSLCWIHDLDGICRIVGDHRIPRLMDEVMQPIVRHLMRSDKSIIYVRPSKDVETVEAIKRTVNENSGYKFILVGLTASYLTLCQRVTQREISRYRIYTQEALDEYLSSRIDSNVIDDYTIMTDDLTPNEVAERIKQIIHDESTCQTSRQHRIPTVHRNSLSDDAVRPRRSKVRSRRV